jgi:hypothetical protein
VPDKEAAKMIPSGVGGDKDGAEKFACVIIHGQQQGPLLIGGPPLSRGARLHCARGRARSPFQRIFSSPLSFLQQK